MKIKVCGPSTARKVVMTKTWKDIKEIESRGEFADYKKIVRKHWADIKPELEKKRCFDVEV